jgi:hypothetical protein
VDEVVDDSVEGVGLLIDSCLRVLNRMQQLFDDVDMNG